MDFWRWLNGVIQLKITSADTTALLNFLQEQGIVMEQVQFVDDLTLQLSIKRQDFRRLQKIVDKRGETLEIIHRSGIYWCIVSLKRRPVLVLGLALLVVLTVFLPTRIFFFQVEGNQNVPTKQILEVASGCGIYFGASRQQVRSEKVKNALLQAAPDLEWAGINTAGCVATISVRERQKVQEEPCPQGVSSIVAIRDGVVQELTVTSGSPVCKPGQAVRTGQVLISGYTDCGLTIRADRAQGEIFAETERNFMLVSPSQWVRKGVCVSERKKYSLIIGKNRINFYQGSGILGTSCDKMYEEKYVTLPGGFVLPVALVTETSCTYQQDPITASAEAEQDRMAQLAKKYLQSQMIAGKILSQQNDFSVHNGLLCLSGDYHCYEMIGQERTEEIIKP